MPKIRIKNLLQTGRQDQDVSVGGWVRTKRVSKNFAFIVISDGSCYETLQIVVEEDSKAFSKLADVTTGGAIFVHGKLKESPAKEQQWELLADDLDILGSADNSYPLQKKGHSLEFLREIGHLRPRTNTFGAVFRVRNTLAYAVHRFFQERSFIWAHTPIITASDCEGAGEMFQVTTLDIANPDRTESGSIDYDKDFFGKKAHLTVSGQLEAEFLALSMGDVYTFGPTFRAENSNTARHLAEFWMIEPEMAFADLSDDIRLAEEFVRYVIGDVVKNCRDELAFFEKMYKNVKIKDLETLAESSFGKISYTDAILELKKASKKFEFPVAWGSDLQTEHERYLTEEVFKKPVAVIDYPEKIKAFYMRLNDDGKTVAAMDVLVPGIGELIGGSQREDRLNLLMDRMKDFDLVPADLQWYLDLRKYGSVPHAGFGLGFERLVMFVTGMQNIRDTILCPRTPKNIAF